MIIIQTTGLENAALSWIYEYIMLPANSSSAMWLVFGQIAQFWKTLFLISHFNVGIHWIKVLWRMKASSKC